MILQGLHYGYIWYIFINEFNVTKSPNQVTFIYFCRRQLDVFSDDNPVGEDAESRKD